MRIIIEITRLQLINNSAIQTKIVIGTACFLLFLLLLQALSMIKISVPYSQVVFEKFTRPKKGTYWSKYSKFYYFSAISSIMIFFIMIICWAQISNFLFFDVMSVPFRTIPYYVYFLLFALPIMLVNWKKNVLIEEVGKKQKSQLFRIKRIFVQKRLLDNKNRKDVKDAGHRFSILPFSLFRLSWCFSILFSPFWLWSGRPHSDIWTFLRFAFVLLAFWCSSFFKAWATVVVIYLLIEMVSYLLRMLFADDPSAIDDTPLQDVGRSLFLFFFNYLDVVFSFACFYAWHFRNEVLELPHYFSFYNTVPFSFLGQMKISNNITVSLHRTIAAEFAIVMFLFLVILVKFIEPFGKRSSSCVRK